MDLKERKSAGARLLEFVETGYEVTILELWILFGWDGVPEKDWEIIEDLMLQHDNSR